MLDAVSPPPSLAIGSEDKGVELSSSGHSSLPLSPLKNPSSDPNSSSGGGSGPPKGSLPHLMSGLSDRGHFSSQYTMGGPRHEDRNVPPEAAIVRQLPTHSARAQLEIVNQTQAQQHGSHAEGQEATTPTVHGHPAMARLHPGAGPGLAMRQPSNTPSIGVRTNDIVSMHQFDANRDVPIESDNDFGRVVDQEISTVGSFTTAPRAGSSSFARMPSDQIEEAMAIKSGRINKPQSFVPQPDGSSSPVAKGVAGAGRSRRMSRQQRLSVTQLP